MRGPRTVYKRGVFPSLPPVALHVSTKEAGPRAMWCILEASRFKVLHAQAIQTCLLSKSHSMSTTAATQFSSCRPSSSNQAGTHTPTRPHTHPRCSAPRRAWAATGDKNRAPVVNRASSRLRRRVCSSILVEGGLCIVLCCGMSMSASGLSGGAEGWRG